ncbi:hypothetical protein Tco_0011615 [Tanacetum coccineum]
MSCLPDDIMEYVISCVLAKETWTDLVHRFEGPPYTKENRVMDLKLDYQTFRAKSTKTLLQTYTRYKTLLNELANDGVNLSKHEINVGFVNSLLEKWLTFSHGLRNANHTQTLDLADIYGRFVYEDNLILKKSSSNSKNQADLRFQKDYKAEYKKMKAKLALLEASPSKVSDKEEVTQFKVLMALADDELTVGKSHARNGKWVDITMRKENTLLSMDEDVDWQNYLKIQITELTKLNHALQDKPESGEKINEKWLTSSKKVERLNPDSKLPNFNSGRILVPESQAVNESLESTETLNTPESSKDSEAESLTLLPPLKNLQGASPSSEDSSNKSVSGTVTVSKTKQTTPLVPIEVKDTEQE